MKIIFLNRFFHPDHSATSQILSDLAFSLAQGGWNVAVITSRQRYDKPSAGLPVRENIRDVSVHRVPSSRFGRKNLAGRAIDYIGFYLFATWRLWHLVRKGDVVIIKTDPPLLSVPAGLVTRMRGAAYINWLQDVFPEIAQASGLGGGIMQALFSFLRRLRNYSLRKARVNVVLGERMAMHLKGEGVAGNQLRIIPNWQDADMVRPLPHEENPLRQQWELEDKCVVAYSGNLGRVHDIEAILGALTLLHEKNLPGNGMDIPEIAFVFIGGGILYEKLQREVHRRDLPNVQFRPYQPREHLSQSLSLADVHLISLKPNFEGLVVPSKYYGIAAAGRASIFIGDEEGEIARLIKDNHCGLVTPTGDGVALVDAIVKLTKNPEKRTQMGERARKIFMQEYSLQAGIGKWNDLLDSIVKKPMP